MNKTFQRSVNNEYSLHFPRILSLVILKGLLLLNGVLVNGFIQILFFLQYDWILLWAYEDFSLLRLRLDQLRWLHWQRA